MILGGKWVGFGLGDTDPDVARSDPNWRAVTLIREKLHAKYQWARDMGVTVGSSIDVTTAAAIAEFQSRADIPVLRDPQGHGYADFRTRVRLGSYPPPPPPRHAMLTFRGTGGIIGQDYTSRIAQMCADVVEEVPILYPAAMGGIPVGAATGPAPSGSECVDVAVDMAADWIENNTATFALCGYSLGAIAASKVRAMLLPGGRLERHAHRYICGVMIGNPARAFGHTYYLGAIPAGYGIADWHLPREACTWDWCELAHPGDLYTSASGGEIGDVLRAAYRLVMDTEVSDPLGMLRKLIPNLLRLLDEAGVDLPLINIPGMVSGALAGLLLAFLPDEIGKLLGMGDNETAAAVQAAVEALRFFIGPPPTRDHISYEHAEVWPGQTYLSLGAQHIRDWSARKTVIAA